MKTLYLEWTNHEYAVIDPDGRVHCWCEDEQKALEDKDATTHYFPGSYIVKVKVDKEKGKGFYPCVSTQYTVEG